MFEIKSKILKGSESRREECYVSHAALFDEKSRLFSEMGNSKYSIHVLCSKRRDEYKQEGREIKRKKAGTGEMREEKEEEMEMNIGTAPSTGSVVAVVVLGGVWASAAKLEKEVLLLLLLLIVSKANGKHKSKTPSE